MSRLPRWQRLLLGTVACAAAGESAHAQWTQLGGSPGRSCAARSVVPDLSQPAWNCVTDEQGNYITFVPQGGLVASLDDVFAVGWLSPDVFTRVYKLFAVSRVTGTVVWSQPVSRPINGSVSGPTLDTVNSTVIVASGSSVTAYAISDGHQVWQTPLQFIVVNASPLVTADRPGRNRVFITDFGAAASLYCINVDPFDAAANPSQPGDIVWRVPIGAASGATPAYLSTPEGGRVFVAHYRETESWEHDPHPGEVFCFPAGATTAPAPIWATDNTIPAGFFGGVGVRSLSNGMAVVYAASYAYYGGSEAANLLKLDAGTGAVLWSAPCNRTDAIPVPVPNGGIVLSGGIAGQYGTVRNMTLFQESGATVIPRWITDASQGVGGRLIQPTAVTTPSGLRLLCAAGSLQDDMGFSSDLLLVDPAYAPDEPGFIVADYEGGGGSAIVANGNVYTVGYAGLLGFGPPPARTDVNQDGRTTVGDLYAWERGLGPRDVDRNGVVDPADRKRLIAELRAFEASDMTGGRP